MPLLDLFRPLVYERGLQKFPYTKEILPFCLFVCLFVWTHTPSTKVKIYKFVVNHHSKCLSQFRTKTVYAGKNHDSDSNGTVYTMELGCTTRKYEFTVKEHRVKERRTTGEGHPCFQPPVMTPPLFPLSPSCRCHHNPFACTLNILR